MTAMLLGQLVEALQDDVVSVLSEGAETEPRIAGGRVARLARRRPGDGLRASPARCRGGRHGPRRPDRDLFSLGDAVAITDTQQIIVAHSNLPDQPVDETRRRGILGRRAPGDGMADHLDREVWTSDTVARHQRPGNLPRLAVVIRAGEDDLGSLWVAFPDDAGRRRCLPGALVGMSEATHGRDEPSDAGAATAPHTAACGC
ncbi:hypothetical protein [Streptomyces caniscabiei]|uniref:hypothetical protein n=1 Tax=Streptomyces caniscabiei TaxID=2746961 RepID=UPI0029B34987|nr:hypothetical protein [Streptomyces caniscabiei]MDX3727295.1 hypothetical protein [Streptomyces caniscabiei]